jgi:small acid-soluble spore protein (thioredoxin-like protein)
MAHKADDRSDNVERIEYNIGKTIENIRKAEDMINITSDEKLKKELQCKNERREESLSAMRTEIRDEAMDKRDHYQ